MGQHTLSLRVAFVSWFCKKIFRPDKEGGRVCSILPSLLCQKTFLSAKGGQVGSAPRVNENKTFLSAKGSQGIKRNEGLAFGYRTFLSAKGGQGGQGKMAGPSSCVPATPFPPDNGGQRAWMFLTHQGQIFLEVLFFTVFILLFLSTVRFFQSLAQKSIQKERLSETKKLNHQEEKPSWFRQLEQLND